MVLSNVDLIVRTLIGPFSLAILRLPPSATRSSPSSATSMLASSFPRTAKWTQVTLPPEQKLSLTLAQEGLSCLLPEVWKLSEPALNTLAKSSEETYNGIVEIARSISGKGGPISYLVHLAVVGQLAPDDGDLGTFSLAHKRAVVMEAVDAGVLLCHVDLHAALLVILPVFYDRGSV